MPICPNCGRVEDEGAIFCEACGTMLKARPASAEAPLEPPLITELRKIGRSGAMLAVVFLLTVFTGFHLLITFFNIAAGSISLPISEIVLCISAWSIRASCNRPVGSLVSTGGITAIRVIKIISIVLLSLGIALFLLVGAIFGTAYSTMYDEISNELGANADIFMMIVFGLLAVIFLMLLFSLFHSIFAVRFYGSVKDTMTSGFPYCKSARTYGILTMIVGVFTALFHIVHIVFLPTINEFSQKLMHYFYSISPEFSDYSSLIASSVSSYRPPTTLTVIFSVATSVFGIASAYIYIIAALLVFRYRKMVTK